MSRKPQPEPPRRRDERIEQALKLLAEEARARLARHPSGHLLESRGETVELELSLPMAQRGARFDELAAEAGRALELAVAGLVTHRIAFRPGAVYCLRCNAADCEHAVPGGPRQVFAGYGPTGLPRFLDHAQLLLERSDPRVDRLYGTPPALLAHTLLGRDLTGELLPAYRANDAGYRLHGQVAAGWYRVPDAAGRPAVLALTFQVVSTRPEGSPRRRYGLNVLGIGPDGEPLENLFDRLGELPWSAAVRWAQEALESIERDHAEWKRGVAGRRRRGRRRRAGGAAQPATAEGGSAAAGGGGDTAGNPGPKSGGPAGEAGESGGPEAGAARGAGLGKRITGVINGLSRRLEKDRRAHHRKTHHARERHAQGDRPTHMALADLARADDADVLVDRRQDTLVVLGDKGRAHVFNPEGKLVTSIRYNPESIERRRRKDQWRSASSEEVAKLRGSVRGTGS